jgi:hypothetical protein
MYWYALVSAGIVDIPQTRSRHEKKKVYYGRQNLASDSRLKTFCHRVLFFSSNGTVCDQHCLVQLYQPLIRALH